MRMAIALSARGLGRTAPNPSVGVLIVSQRDGHNIIVGRGVTASGGRPHAERIALDQAGARARGATLYVTLEPCAHRSVSDDGCSCTDATLAAGIKRVVIGALDPSPFAAGKGITFLRENGVEVVSGVEEKAACYVNLGHILRVTEHRPFVLLKLAQTADGFAGTMDGKPLAITGEEARTRVHLMRAQSDAIAIGIETALADDPELTVRLHGLEHRSPIRVVFDSRLRLSLQSKLILTCGKVPTWIITGPDAPADAENALKAAGALVLRVAQTADGNLDLHAATQQLAARGITRLMVEGGPKLANAFASAGLIDEAAIFTADWKAKGGQTAILPDLARSLAEIGNIAAPAVTLIGKDRLQIFRTAMPVVTQKG